MLEQDSSIAMNEHQAEAVEAGARAGYAARHRWQRAALWAVLCLGLGIALWPVGQAVYGWWSQRELRQNWERQWQAEVAHEKAALAVSHSGHKRGARPRKTRARSAASKQLPTTRIVIPSIDLDAVVVSGVTEAALKRGPGHDSTSSLPGQRGNCVIAAHRNSYGWWFYKLNQLSTNASIELRTPRARYIYAMASTRVLPDTATWALRPPPRGAAPRLTLYTCALPHGSRRVVVTARLMRIASPAD